MEEVPLQYLWLPSIDANGRRHLLSGRGHLGQRSMCGRGPLISLNFLDEKLSANFRYAFIRIREYGENIAFYRGEARHRESVAFYIGDVHKVLFVEVGLSDVRSNTCTPWESG